MIRTCLYIIFSLFLFSYGASAQSNSAVLYLNPKWSPDGRSIAFTSNSEGKFAVYTLSVDGSRLKRITDLQYDSGLPDWLRDGKTLVYYRSPADGLLKLFSNDTSGTNEKQLSFLQSVDYAASTSANRIVFNRREGMESLNHDLYSMNTDGTGLQKLTDGRYDYSAPVYSPDGKQIVLIRTDPMRKPFKESTQQEILRVRNSGEIVVMNADGSSMRSLTNDTIGNRCPSWSGDGKTVYYMESFHNRMTIFKVSPDGSNKELVHTPAGNPNNFHISADGRYIVYGLRDSLSGLYVYDLATKTERKLT